jgi:hypothetical protein
MELSRPKLDAILQREAGASAPCASLWLLRMTTYYFFSDHYTISMCWIRPSRKV